MPAVTPPRPDDGGTPPQLVILAHDGIIRALAYLPDGRRIVTGSVEGTVKVWNLENGEQEGTPMEHDQEVISVAVTRDGTKIISTDADPDIDEYWGIRMWDVESHELVREWTRDSEGNCPNVAISPDDRLIAVGQWDVGIYTMQGRLVNDIKVDKEVWSMSFSPDGKELACGCGHWDNIHVYDVYTGALVLGPLRGHRNYVNCVLWSRDGSRLFSASDDKTIRCWNTDTGEEIGQPWTGHTDGIYSISLSPDGSILASASRDKTVRFWNATSGHPIVQYLQHDEPLDAVCFSPSGECVVSAGCDPKIHLWRVPWLDSVERQTGHATGLVMACDTMHCAQPPFFHAPPPSRDCIHFPTTEQVSGRDLGLYHTDQRITSSAVLDLYPTAAIRHSKSTSFGTSTVSYEADVEYILPHPSLGIDERQRIFELQLRKMLDLATSTGLRVPGDLIPSKSSLPVGIQNTPWTGLASIANGDCNSMHASQIESHSTSNGDPKKIRKIDEIKKKLVEMLREIGFKLSNGRLPWSTLERDLRKKGYVIANWPHGVDRDRDKGVSGLSAGDADKLHGALFVDDCQIQFVRCKEYASDNDGVTSLAVASSSSGGPREINHSSTGRALPRFRVTTAEEYPNKRRRV